MVNGLNITDSTQVTDGKLKTVSLVVDGLSLTKGTDYSVSVTATNSIGESEPVMGTLSVPSECVSLFMLCVFMTTIHPLSPSQILPSSQHLLLSSLQTALLLVVLE